MKKTLNTLAIMSCLPLLLAAPGCGHEDDHDHGNEGEVITTVTLTFTPVAGGTPVVAKADDPDGDGGNPPTVTPVTLSPGTYNLAVGFENGLQTPPVDIGAEVRDEGTEHQVFFTGTAVNGPASNVAGAPLTQAYADMDTQGLPLGLVNTFTAVAGTGTLTVTLRHMPPLNGAATKTATAAEVVRAGGFDTLGGDTDVQVSFPVTVK